MVDKMISDYMKTIGAAGGRKGGKMTGPKKARSPEHYARMVAARQAQRAIVKSSAQNTCESE